MTWTHTRRLCLCCLLALGLVSCQKSSSPTPEPLVDSGVNLAFTPSQAQCMQDYMAICNDLLFRLNGVADTSESSNSSAGYNSTDLHAYLLYCEPRPGSEIDRGDPCERLCGVAEFSKASQIPAACAVTSAPTAPPETEWCDVLSETQEQYDQLDANEKALVTTLRSAIDTEQKKVCQ